MSKSKEQLQAEGFTFTEAPEKALSVSSKKPARWDIEGVAFTQNSAQPVPVTGKMNKDETKLQPHYRKVFLRGDQINDKPFTIKQIEAIVEIAENPEKLETLKRILATPEEQWAVVEEQAGSLFKLS